ncbi:MULTISPECIES: GAF domain-containing protein [Marinovum]|uniref:GAF domain-containing protein n=1 Tax=Marinovum TaxID=367771 RepID=UPI00237B6810|nr:GAF domain-containing protein [Marinovum sp. PR37]MDD9742902.1 GAF domain-containing protein [Marinovum sp. PR37]
MVPLETLFNRALDAVVGMDESGHVTAWNGSAEEIFGWSREEALGALMGDLIVPPQYREAHARGLAHYNRTGEGPVLEQRIQITAMHRDGHEFPVELSIFPMREERCFYAFIRSMVAEEAARREQEFRAREADALLAVAQKLLDDVSLDEFTQFCLDTVCSVSGMKAGHFHVVRGTGRQARLHPTGIWHLADPRLAPVVEVTAPLRFRRGEGLPGRAWQSGQLEALENLSASDQFVRRDTFSQVGLTRAVALPVSQGGQVHGVLEFFGTEEARLDSELLRMLQTIGSQIGVAIRRKESAEHRETLRREMSHRVGNSLTVLASIYRSCSKVAKDKAELDEAFLGRLMAVGRANRIAVEDGGQGLALPALIRAAIGILPDHGSITIETPELVVGGETVMPLALVLNELATNTLKHNAAYEDARLSICGRYDTTQGHLVLEWRETRNAPLASTPSDPERIGFGTQLIQLMVEGRLDGTCERKLDETGFLCTLRLPTDRIAAPADPAPPG